MNGKCEKSNGKKSVSLKKLRVVAVMTTIGANLVKACFYIGGFWYNQ